MEKRYYYTDPLAAGWMAKHFGMRFVENFEVTEQFIDGRLVTQTYPAKLHVSTNSVHVFLPQIGDILCLGDECILVSPDHHEYRGRGQFMTVNEAKEFRFQIIQRDGKPFFWPESEN